MGFWIVDVTRDNRPYVCRSWPTRGAAESALADLLAPYAAYDRWRRRLVVVDRPHHDRPPGTLGGYRRVADIDDRDDDDND